jgi:hypothetical protein
MRRRNSQGLNAIAAVLAIGAGRPRSDELDSIYRTTPADLEEATEKLQRREEQWRRAGSPRVDESQVDEALGKAEALQKELNEVKAHGRPGVKLIYLNLVRLFVLTRLPGFGKVPVIGGSAAMICALSLISSPFIFPSSATAGLEFACCLTVIGSSLASGAILLLWPTEAKRDSYQRLERERKENKKLAETMRPRMAQAWDEYERLRELLSLCDRVRRARRRRDEVAALLASVKYQLIHTDWRSMRGDSFELFLSRVFEFLGYRVQLTKASGDQGADLLVSGKGRKIAVQAKGYADSVGNHAVMEVTASMAFYGCDSCVVITNSHFTRTAIQLAQANDCRLIDGAQIPGLILGHIY